MAKPKKEKVLKLYRSFSLTEEEAVRLDMMVRMGRRFNPKYTKGHLFRDAMNNFWDLLNEATEAKEAGELEIEYQH